MTDDIEHLFGCLFASSEKRLFLCSAHFLIRLLFFLWSLKNSLYILGTRLLLHTWLTNLFSRTVCSLSLHPLMGIFQRTKVFHLGEVQFINSFYGLCSWC